MQADIAQALRRLATAADKTADCLMTPQSDAPIPQTGAEKDERVWTVVVDGDDGTLASTSMHANVRSYSNASATVPHKLLWETLNVVPKSRLDQAEWELAEAKRLLDIRTASRDRWKKLALHDQLDEMRSQREQITALTADRDNWQANAERENAMLVTCQEERDEKDRQLTQCYAKLEEALQQRDALAKRVEEGKVLWQDENGSIHASDPYKWTAAAQQLYGPFTRGRFVTDVAEEDFR